MNFINKKSNDSKIYGANLEIDSVCKRQSQISNFLIGLDDNFIKFVF